MLGLALKLLGGWKIKAILAGVAALAIGAGIVYVKMLQAQRDTAVLELAVAESEMQRLSAANQANLVALQNLELEKAVAQASLAARIADIRRLESTASTALGGIEDAPETSDAAVAPLYLDTLRRLREREERDAAAGGGDP